MHTRTAAPLFNGHRKSKLFEVLHEAVFFKKIFVILKVIPHAIKRFLVVALDEKPPVLVALAKINRAVHGLHAPREQPFFAGFKHQKSHGFVLNALKKTHSSRWLVVVFGGRSVVYKRRHAAHSLATGVLYHPPNTFAIGKKFVFICIEHLRYVLI